MGLDKKRKENGVKEVYGVKGLVRGRRRTERRAIVCGCRCARVVVARSVRCLKAIRHVRRHVFTQKLSALNASDVQATELALVVLTHRHLDVLARHESAPALCVGLDFAVMDEEIGIVVEYGDETVAFRVVEPLDAGHIFSANDQFHFCGRCRSLIGRGVSSRCRARVGIGTRPRPTGTFVLLNRVVRPAGSRVFARCLHYTCVLSCVLIIFDKFFNSFFLLSGADRQVTPKRTEEYREFRESAWIF